jgi:hypothetical protein
MPAVDPFSASFRPFVSRDKTSADRIGRDTPLQSIDQNAASNSDNSTLPKARRYKDELPLKYYEPPYRHTRDSSAASIDRLDILYLEKRSQDDVEVGSDTWMENEVSQCLYTSKGALDVK